MSWLGHSLRNIQGQLAEFTSEVLTESTEEVQDAETEIQVAKKRFNELNNKLSNAEKEVSLLRTQVRDSEERAEAALLQLDTLSQRYRMLLENKETEIRELQDQIHTTSSCSIDSPTDHWHGWQPSSDVDYLSSSPPLSPSQEFELHQLRDQVKQLKAEVTHWKSLVHEQTTPSEGENLNEEVIKLRQQLSDIVDKHQTEILSLQENNYEKIQSLRTQYEARISALQAEAAIRQETSTDDGWNTAWNDEENEDWKGSGELSNVSSSNQTPASELMTKLEALERQRDELKKEKASLLNEKHSLQLRVADEKQTNSQLKTTVDSLKKEEEKTEKQVKKETDERREELEREVIELKSSLETIDAQHEAAIQQILTSKQECLSRITELESALAERADEKNNFDKILSQLRAENHELTSAYNDLNDEYESHKSESGSIVSANRDLSTRIESLKADLIEYEEKYERCKMENLNATKQLETLTSDFDKLKAGLESARATSFEGETKLATDVARLQIELKESLSQREQLVIDVGAFQGSVNNVEVELEKLHSSNQLLMAENVDLRESLKSLSNMKDAFGETESELGIMRTKLQEFQNETSRQEKEMREQLEELEEESGRLRHDVQRFRGRNDELEAILVRYRSVVGEEAAKIVEVGTDISVRKSDDETSGDSNGWDKLREVDIETIKQELEGAVGGEPKISNLELQLKEALAALTEKTEECENVQKQLTDKTQELVERDELLQQAFTELKGLECQLADSRQREGTLKTNVQRLTVETARKDQEIAQLKEHLETVEEQAQTLTEMDSVRTKMAEAENAVFDTQKQIAAMTEQLTTNCTMREQVELELRQGIEENEHKLIQEREINEKLKKALEEKEAVIEQLNEESAMKIKEAVNYEFKDMNNQLEMATIELKDKLRVKEEQMAEERNNVEELKKELEMKTLELNDKFRLNEELVHQQKSMQEMEKQLDMAKSELNKSTVNQEELVSERNSVQELKIQLEMAATELHDKLSVKEEELIDERNRMEEMKRQFEMTTNEIKGKIRMTEDELTHERNTVLELKCSLNEREFSVENNDSNVVEELNKCQETLNQIQSEKQQLVLLVNGKHEECVKYHAEVQKLAELCKEKTDKVNSVERELESLKHLVDGVSQTADHEVEKKNAELERLKAEVERLTERIIESESALAMWAQKEVELERIQTELSTVHHLKGRAVSELDVERNRTIQLANQLQLSEENRIKTEKELERLRQHLLQVEENYTREAVGAEERETQLRQKLRQAEDSAFNHSEAASNSSRYYQDQVEDLKLQLESMANQRDGAVLELTDLQQEYEKNQKALMNLQGVLRHFQEEKDSEAVDEVQRTRGNLEKLKTDNNGLMTELSGIQSRLTELETAKEKTEFDLQTTRGLLESREDELNQMMMKYNELQYKYKNTKGADKELLKNLFIGYLTSPDERKKEVARLLASVLGFSADDLRKVDGSQSGGWLSFIRGGASPDNSMTAQFIHFLESESTPSPSTNTTPLPSPFPTEYTTQRSRTSSRNSPVFPYNRSNSGVPSNMVTPGSEFALPTFQNSKTSVARSSDILREVLQD